ncbi:MAG TPA: hypothetical protein VFT72_13205 [Opitutaceae bacterium]|nr:hypothetical protein [Opitutaceae bacterium]
MKLLLAASFAASFAFFSAVSIAASSRGLLLVANKGDHSLTIIDAQTQKTLGTVAEDGVTGHEVTATLDGRRAFVPIYGSGGVGGPGTDGHLVRVIDLDRREIVATVDFGRGVRPHCAVTGPKSGLIYVTSELLQSVSVIDPTTSKIVASIPTGKDESHMFAISQDETRGYTANVGSGTVSVLDIPNRKTITVIPVADIIQRISLSADDRFVFTSDQREPRIAVIDTATNKVARWIKLPDVGFASTATPDGKTLIVVLTRSNRVCFVDLKTMDVTDMIELARAPQEVLVEPDGSTAYVSCDATRQVAVIDLSKHKVTGYLAAGAVADGLAWAKR